MKQFSLIIKLAALLCWVAPNGFAQNTEAGRSLVHFDKSFYVNGEVIWYKLYLPAAFREQDPAIKVKLLNSLGQTVHYAFLKTGGALFAHGYFKIPFDFPTGMYHLLFIANENSEKKPVVLAEVPVPVYNDDPRAVASTAREAAAGGTEPATAPLLPPDELQVVVTVEPGQIKSRETVRATVTVRDGAGRPVRANLSVAVTDWDLVNYGTSDQPTVMQGGTTISGGMSFDGLPYAKVIVRDSAGAPLQANVLGVFSPADNEMKFAKSNGEGFSFVELSEFTGPKSVQMLGYYKETENIQVRLLEEDIALSEKPLIFNEEIASYLQLSRLRKKIFQNRTALEFELNPEAKGADPLTLIPDQVINIQEYESFENLGTFFREVTTPLRFRQRADETYFAEMSIPGAQRNTFFYPGNPMFIIDGKVTRNADFVAQMSTDQIQTVELYFRRDNMRNAFKVFGNSGVAVIKTSIPDVEVPADDADDILQVYGLNPAAEFPVFDPAQLDNDPRKAFFRPQLYWNPDLRTNESGERSFTFHQSDDLSTFRIEVVAQGENGELGRGTFEYEVK